MKVNGYMLREAIRRWQLRRDTAVGQFPKTLTSFANEVKPSPDEIGKAALEAELAIAQLQTAQTQYNARVVVDYAPGWTLIRCIKTVGGVARIEKLWRTAAVIEKSPFASLVATRKADELVATRVLSYEDAAKRTEELGKMLSGLREAIAVANATELDIDLDAKLLE